MDQSRLIVRILARDLLKIRFRLGGIWQFYRNLARITTFGRPLPKSSADELDPVLGMRVSSQRLARRRSLIPRPNKHACINCYLRMVNAAARFSDRAC
jgi:hypothetical protein